MSDASGRYANPEMKWISSTGYTVVKDSSINVVDAALDRIRTAYGQSDKIAVSFSGGKDSTCVLMLTLYVAKELNRLPLDVCMFDEEIIDPDTIEYVAEVQSWADVNFKWFCVPLRHTLRSKGRDHWITWDDSHKDIWARDLPPGAITSFPGMGFGFSIAEQMDNYYKSLAAESGTKHFFEFTGIRVQESMNRRRSLLTAGTWVTRKLGMMVGKPIYDWNWTDVWKAISDFGWPHSHFYDRLWLKGVSPQVQRVAPWGNVASAREAKYYPEFYPDFWDRVLRRLPELSAQARYGDTKLYRQLQNKPDGMTWQEYTIFLIEQFDSDEVKQFWYKQIEELLKSWSRYATIPLPELPLEEKARCWKTVAASVQKNDLFRMADGNLSTRDWV